MSANEDGHEIMDNMENRLSLMGVGEGAYCILVGAQSAGADQDDGIAILTAWFMAGVLVNPTAEEEVEDGDEQETD